ncbi:MAG: lysophospholipid acyltransferase family protein [Verrucomicrobia bacterium]|nr:lysophospholipid acyltransferase family protein [Verrucomicrobiota bacterium]
MNIFRPQVPYVFRPPRYSPFWAPLLRQFSATFMLSRKFKTRVTSVEGLERLAALNREGHALLVAPNHADHADPHVLVYAGRQQGVALHFMAAREGFEKGRLSAFALQRMGAFSVDREGADVSAIKMAIQLLQKGVFPLVMFPEGEIYHHHESLDELNVGVATILLRASAKLKDGKRAYIIPTALRYVHAPGVEATFAARMSRLENSVTWKPRPHVDIVERIYRLGGGLIALKEQEFLGCTMDAPLVERIVNLQKSLVEQIEEKHGRSGASDRIPDRVKVLRSKVRKGLLEQGAQLDERAVWSLYDDLDRLFVAVQLYSYPGQYLADAPSVDRIAETLLKLEEDVLGEGEYPVLREAHVRFDEPLEVNAFLADRGLEMKTGVGPLTQHVAERIQSMLESV